MNKLKKAAAQPADIVVPIVPWPAMAFRGSNIGSLHGKIGIVPSKPSKVITAVSVYPAGDCFEPVAIADDLAEIADTKSTY